MVVVVVVQLVVFTGVVGGGVVGGVCDRSAMDISRGVL